MTNKELETIIETTEQLKKNDYEKFKSMKKYIELLIKKNKV